MEQQKEKNINNKRWDSKLKDKHADWILALISFTESAFSPILVDPFLVALTLIKTNRWVRFAAIASIASVIGGVFGYFLGATFFNMLGAKIIELYNLETIFEKTVSSFGTNAFYFTLLGAFTPIPYKIVALVGGFLKINIGLFILASIIGRSARFFLVGYVTKQFGERALAIFSKRFSTVTAAIVAGVGLYALMTFVR